MARPRQRGLLHEDLPADPAGLLKATAPYREDLVVGAEFTFSWYWLADLCQDLQIAFVLGHALYMKARPPGQCFQTRDAAAMKCSDGTVHISGRLPPGPPCDLHSPRGSPNHTAT